MNQYIYIYLKEVNEVKPNETKADGYSGTLWGVYRHYRRSTTIKSFCEKKIFSFVF